ncbi:MAG: hypothetical protein ACRQFF_10640 [Sphaerochaeta sp.]
MTYKSTKKKLSALLGVSAIALSTLAAEPTFGGWMYTWSQATLSESNDTFSEGQYSYAEAGFNLTDKIDNATLFFQDYIVYDGTSDISNSIDYFSMQYDFSEDEFGNGSSLRVGKYLLDMGANGDYNAGDVLTYEATEDEDERWLLSYSAPVVSNESGALILTPFTTLPIATDVDPDSVEGYGLISKYAFADSSISSVEAVAYYNADDNSTKVAGAIKGDLGMNFGIAGNIDVTNTNDWDASFYASKIVDKTEIDLQFAYMNEYYDSTTYAGAYLKFCPTLSYLVSDNITIDLENVTKYAFEEDEMSNTLNLSAECYLNDSFYITPGIETGFDSDEIVAITFEAYQEF